MWCLVQLWLCKRTVSVGAQAAPQLPLQHIKGMHCVIGSSSRACLGVFGKGHAGLHARCPR